MVSFILKPEFYVGMNYLINHFINMKQREKLVNKKKEPSSILGLLDINETSLLRAAINNAQVKLLNVAAKRDVPHEIFAIFVELHEACQEFNWYESVPSHVFVEGRQFIRKPKKVKCH